MPLDKSKPYGTIYGEHHCAYTQGGKDYNAEGLEVDKTGKAIEDRSALMAQKSSAASVKRPNPNPPAIDPEDEIAEDEEIDLLAWARGEVKAPWNAVVAALQRKFDVIVHNKVEALDLVNKRMGE